VSREKNSRPVVYRRLRGKDLIDCMDTCSQWLEEERPCPTNGRVERVAGRIVTALSAEGQLIALLDTDERCRCLEFLQDIETSAEPEGQPTSYVL
jgi:hypothetical protein